MMAWRGERFGSNDDEIDEEGERERAAAGGIDVSR